MHIAKVMQYCKRLMELGPVQSSHIVHNKIQKQLFSYRQPSASTWQNLQQFYQITSWNSFFSRIKNKNWHHMDQVSPVQTDQTILENAHQYLHKNFSWHIGFEGKKYAHYATITIPINQTKNCGPDIKTPWELSRFQHLLILGKAYQITGDEKYAQAFMDHIDDWLKNNTYLYGVNWLSPMEVGIRALNWIWAFQFFKNSPSISALFWKRFICSLHDHQTYLENNWELYDGRTNNHYLSNLIGYFYLCLFFQPIQNAKKADWCFEEFLQEFNKQVFDEGTSYEGSTAYHAFVTEIATHFFYISQELGFTPLPSFTKKLELMHTFNAWCGSELYIGDNDSGSLLFYGLLPQTTHKKNGTIHFKKFGLSIIRTKDWHTTLRHHAYQSKQPSGHFHNDALSITLTYNNIPIFVDPGTYVYTPSTYWRNYFRSALAHTTFFVEKKEPIPFDSRLFALAMPEGKTIEQKEYDSIVSSHDVYAHYGLRAHRELSLEDDSITITDWWEKLKETTPMLSSWHFTLHPAIVPDYQNGTWILRHNGTPILTLHSDDLLFSCHETFVSCAYGTKEKSTQLRALLPIRSKKIVTRIQDY